jgi:hypothetical protein
VVNDGAIIAAKSSSYISLTAKDTSWVQGCTDQTRKKLAYKRERVSDSGIERSPYINYESKMQSVGQFEVCKRHEDVRALDIPRTREALDVSTEVDFCELLVGKIST